jgi:hypothetical protein
VSSSSTAWLRQKTMTVSNQPVSRQSAVRPVGSSRRLAMEDQEQDPDRWVSCSSHGQEFWQIIRKSDVESASGVRSSPPSDSDAHHRICPSSSRTSSYTHCRFGPCCSGRDHPSGPTQREQESSLEPTAAATTGWDPALSCGASPLCGSLPRLRVMAGYACSTQQGSLIVRGACCESSVFCMERKPRDRAT